MSKFEPLRDVEMFDTGDVTWEIDDKGKRRDIVKIVLKTDTSFNLVKVYLSLKMICKKIETQLGILDEAEGEH